MTIRAGSRDRARLARGHAVLRPTPLAVFHLPNHLVVNRALVGASACLRKCIYAVCDDLQVAGDNYREKIDNLPAKKSEYRELLKQVKFLGDNMTKPSGTEYTKEQIDLALEVLPLALDDIYATDGKVLAAQKILAKVQSKNEDQKS